MTVEKSLDLWSHQDMMFRSTKVLQIAHLSLMSQLGIGSWEDHR